MRGATCGTDHYMVRAVCNLRTAPVHQKRARQPPRKLDVSLLPQKADSEELENKVSDRINQLQEPTSPDRSVNERWGQVSSVVYAAAREVLGHPRRRHADWFDQNDTEIERLIAEVRACRQQSLTGRSTRRSTERLRDAHSKLQRATRRMKNEWWNCKAEELQRYADAHMTRAFYDGLKAVYGPRHSGSNPVLSADGSTVYTTSAEILKRWKEHFQQLLNRPSTVDGAAIERLKQRPTRHDLDRPPTIEELQKALKSLKSGKAPGVDGIPAEVLKHSGEVLHNELLWLYQRCWEDGAVPQDFKDAMIVTIYKRKGDRRDCGNSRGISLLSIAGKLLAKVALSRLQVISEEILPESQCGFRPDRGTTDMIFALRQLQEKAMEQRMGLYIVFIDFTKAFDSVGRDALWRILEKFGCPPRLLGVIKAFHTDMRATVTVDCEVSDFFQVLHGVKQGCILAPTLFALFLAAVIEEMSDDDLEGIYIRTRSDGGLFNLARLKSQRHVLVKCIRELLYADDSALVAHTLDSIQRLLEKFAEAARAYGMTINIKKTEVLYQPAPGKPHIPPQVLLDGTPLAEAETFTYLGSTVSNDNSMDSEIDARRRAASAAFGRLKERLWNVKSIQLNTKLNVYRAVVLSALLYGLEVSTLYARHVRQLSVLVQRHLRGLMGITWQDRISNVEVLRRAGMPAMEAMITRSQLRWTGHVIRMPEERLPRDLLYSELREGSRPRGRPRLRYKDTLKRRLGLAGISHQQLETLAIDRAGWRAVVRKSAKAVHREWEHRADKQCDDGYYGQNCAKRCGVCVTGTTCHKADGRCSGCENPWVGDTCKMVPATILDHPDSFTVAIHDKATFSCTGRGVPAPTVVWHHDDEIISPGDQVSVETTYGGLVGEQHVTNSTLTITSARPHDSGQYVCIMSNPAGVGTSEEAALVVQVNPVVSIRPSEVQDLVVGEVISITCNTKRRSSDYTYQWTVDGVVVPNQRGAVFRYKAVSGVHKVRCKVTSPSGEAESEDSTINVLSTGTVTFVSSMRITGRNFTPEMENPDSAAFQSISTEIKDWYQQALGHIQGNIYIRVKDAKPGSIITNQNVNVQDAELQDQDLFDSISNALQTAARTPSSLGLDPTSLTFLTTTCYGETVTVTDPSSNRVNLTFPDSASDTHVYSEEKCANNTESAGVPLAVRRCMGTFQTGVTWAKPELLDCGRDLSKLAEVPVTPDNVAEVAADLQILTSVGSSLMAENIADASTVLDNLVNTTGDENVGYSVVVSVDQIMNTDEDVLQQSQVNDQSLSRIVRAIEQFNDRVNLTSNRFRRIEKNIGVETYKVQAAELMNSVGFAFLDGSEDLEDGLVRSYSDSSSIPNDQVDASIVLPATAFLKGNISDENRRIRVVYSRTHARKFQIYGHFQVCATRTLGVCGPAHGPDMNHSGVRAVYRPAHLVTGADISLVWAPVVRSRPKLFIPRCATSLAEAVTHGPNILCHSTALSRDTVYSPEGCTSYLRRVTCAGPYIPVHTTNYQVSGHVRRYHRPAHAVADISCTHPDTPGHAKFHGTCTDPSAGEVRLSFIIYLNSRLFQSNQTSPGTKTRVNSRVIASKVTGIELKNLSNPVVTRYLPLVPNSTDSTVNNMRCVFWDFEAEGGVGAWSTEGCAFAGIDNGRVVCECNHLTNFAVLMDIYGGLHSFLLDLISKIGIVVSITGLTLTLISYLIFKQLRKTRPQHILTNLCIALLATLILFLTGIDATHSPIGCTIVAFLLHYFLLAVFMWMAVEAFNMYLAFIKVLGAHVSRFILKAAIFAWGLPLVIAIATLAVDVPGTYPNGQGTYRSTSVCWLQGNQLYYGFLLPAGLVLVFNVIVYIMVISKLSCGGRTDGKIAHPGSGATKQNLRIAIAIMVLVGLTWIFGFFMISDGRIVFSYLFCIFNSLQGFFIFIFHCLRQKEVRNLWLKFCGCLVDDSRATKYSTGTSSSNPTDLNTDYNSRGQLRGNGTPRFPCLPKALQKLINVCEAFDADSDMIFCTKKTNCMYFPCDRIALNGVPPAVKLSGKALPYVSSATYLGFQITPDLSDDDSIPSENAIVKLLLRSETFCSSPFWSHYCRLVRPPVKR
ncbi:hypothetical protein Bbelb_160260 [Branchiostoma belcheri]|nr:hypothetical protein Bbelb_160260 [Branchiostoma belcheri]